MPGTTTNFAIPYPTSTDYVTDGATAMRSLADQVDAVMYSGTPARNFLFNGAMQISQRMAVGTAITGVTSTGYFTADRWKTTLSSLGTWSQTTIVDAPTGSGFRNSFRMACTTANASPAAGAALLISQEIEGQNLQAIRKGTASAQPITLSFWVKAFQTGTYICELTDNDNNRSVSRAYTITASATWQYVIITFPADTTGVFDNDNNSSLSVNWWLGAGSTFTSGTLATIWGTVTNANRAVGQTNVASSTSNYWQVTGAQLIVGSVAVPFQFKSFADDLRDCQRYYEKSYPLLVTPGTTSDPGLLLVSAGSDNIGRSVIPISFKVPKRSTSYTIATWRQTGAPNIWDIAWSTGGGTATPSAAYQSENTMGLFVAVAGQPAYAVCITYGHWSVSAEL
jgi:hypothetical protein